ncbi:MAG: NmrA/HSCARG family protein [Spirochaetales bacterium]|nr:NmrA/HSCARG family protein [Spirochaetales bacterium]
MENRLNILVTGATGKQGGAVARSLLKKGHHVRALTRKTDSKNAIILKNEGAEIVKGDFTDTTLLRGIMQDLDGIFIMSTPYESGVKEEVIQGKNVIDAAIASRVKHIVFSSVANADKNTGIPHFESKYELEKYLSDKSIHYTIAAPAFFFDNFTSPLLLPGLRQGFFYQALPSDVPLQSVSVDSIGEFVTHVFENPDLFYGKRIDIAEDELNGDQYANILTDASGKDILYVEIPVSEVRKNSDDMALMYEWFHSVGYSVDIKALKEKYSGIKWYDFEDWAFHQDWKNKLNVTEKVLMST